jgi:LPS-assembly protein
VAPNGGNPDKIPNEDSADFELDDTNFRSPNRFPGLDRVDGGQRLYYGVKGGVYGADGGVATAFIGQSYSLRKDDTFSLGSGLDNNFSDLIGRVTIRPRAPLNLQYRFRFNKDDLDIQRNELQVNIGPRALNLSADYIFIDQNAGSGEFADREEITAAVTSQLTKTWSTRASTRRDLTEDGGSLNHAISFTYRCDCFTFTTTFARSFTRDRDLKPTDTIFVRLIFKTLGAFTAATQR